METEIVFNDDEISMAKMNPNLLGEINNKLDENEFAESNDSDKQLSNEAAIYNQTIETASTEKTQSDEAQEESREANKENGEAIAKKAVSQADRPCAFAISRIKTLMKMDADMALASKESVFLVAKATELFVDLISKEAYKFTSQGLRKTIQKKDIEQAVNSVDCLCFLDAALD